MLYVIVLYQYRNSFYCSTFNWMLYRIMSCQTLVLCCLTSVSLLFNYSRVVVDYFTHDYIGPKPCNKHVM